MKLFAQLISNTWVLKTGFERPNGFAAGSGSMRGRVKAFFISNDVSLYCTDQSSER